METSPRAPNPGVLAHKEAVHNGDDDGTVGSLQTPPPGFAQGPSRSPIVNTASDGSSLRMLGALSAPPPPGFNSGIEDRGRISQLLWADEGCRQLDSDGGLHEINGFDERTTSFSNLAAVVGTGLAESMEDSTRETHAVSTETHTQGEPLGTSRSRGVNDMFDPENDLSYARQSRHAASRLIGIGTTISNSTGSAGYSSVSSSTLMHPLGSLVSFPSQIRGPYDPGNTNASTQSSSSRSFPTEEATSAGVLSREGAGETVSPGSPVRWPLPTKDVGVTVMEPVDLGRNSAPPKFVLGEVMGEQQLGTHREEVMESKIQHVEREMRNISIISDARRSFPEQLSSPDVSHRRSEAELSRFVWDVYQTEPSRTVVILRAASLHIPDVRSTCEAFGVLEYFRVDFSGKGIIFVGYYDIRSAQYAAVELKSCLKRLAVASLSSDPVNGSEGNVDVKYCVPLNWSSALDESRIVLSQLPPGADDETLKSILSSYGAVRSIRKHSDCSGFFSVVVEFHNIQDAKQALLELESTQPWGREVLVELGNRDVIERRKGRDLLALIGSWRHGRGSVNTPMHSFDRSYCAARVLGADVQRTPASSTSPAPSRTPSDGTPTQPNFSSSFRNETPNENQNSLLAAARQGSASSASSSPMVAAPEMSVFVPPPSLVGSENSSSRPQTTQLLLGPDGQYSYVVVNHAAYQHGPRPHHQSDSPSVHLLHSHPSPHHFVLGPQGSYIHPSQNSPVHIAPGANTQHTLHWTHPPASLPHPQFHQTATASVVRTSPFVEPRAFGGGSQMTLPFCAHVSTGAPGNNYGVYTDSSVSSGSGSSPHPLGGARDGRAGSNRALTVGEKDAKHLVLDVAAVENGKDKRTSVMVRNIPNKYTQQMLLSEFTENGHGPGMIDFFYLPIDFKNRCNRGYAFVNFVDYRDIVSFHRQYYGRHWRVFNSDKICDITYARIQGQAGLLKRFENSALMEKDDEYKPLVFVSHGEDKGKRLKFPSPS